MAEEEAALARRNRRLYLLKIRIAQRKLKEGLLALAKQWQQWKLREAEASLKHAAATQIQKIVRGRKGRKRAQNRRRRAARRLLQRCGRGMLGRLKAKRRRAELLLALQNAMATKIQTRYRIVLAVRLRQTKAFEKEFGIHEVPLRIALHGQRLWRGYYDRFELAVFEKKVITRFDYFFFAGEPPKRQWNMKKRRQLLKMQAVARGFLVRRRRQNAAVTLLARIWRGTSCRWNKIRTLAKYEEIEAARQAAEDEAVVKETETAIVGMILWIKSEDGKQATKALIASGLKVY